MLETLRCANCGYRNDPRVRLCQLCSSLIGDHAKRPTSPRAAAPPAPPPPERHFVVPVIGERVKVEPGVKVVIGRDQACQIRCRSEKVSRKHAEITLDGKPPKPVLKDLGSHNGTFVNGKPMPTNGTHALEDKDEIEVGDVKVTYRKLAPGESEQTLQPDSQAATVGGVLETDEVAISGYATYIPLASVVARLQELGASGCLRVEGNRSAGALYFHEGAPRGGRFGGLGGPAALAAVIALQDGKFRFEPMDASETAPDPSAEPPPAPGDTTTPWFEKKAPGS